MSSHLGNLTTFPIHLIEMARICESLASGDEQNSYQSIHMLSGHLVEVKSEVEVQRI